MRTFLDCSRKCTGTQRRLYIKDAPPEQMSCKLMVTVLNTHMAVVQPSGRRVMVGLLGARNGRKSPVSGNAFRISAA